MRTALQNKILRIIQATHCPAQEKLVWTYNSCEETSPDDCDSMDSYRTNKMWVLFQKRIVELHLREGKKV